MLTYGRVRELFDYDTETGVLYRSSAPQGTKVGDVVGNINSNGYLQCGVDNGKYAVHRVIWLWNYGYLPELEIDHIDRNRTNNKLANLREVSPQCNRRNSCNRLDNSSGVKGVSWNKKSRKWLVQIAVFGHQKYGGLHADFDEAVCTRLALEQCLGWLGCDSDSSAYRHVHNNIQGR